MTAPGAAYEAAVEAMARGLHLRWHGIVADCLHPTEPQRWPVSCGIDHLGPATSALAALVANEDVRAALEDSECLLHPGQEKCGGAVRGSNVRFHLPCFLATLSPGGSTQPTTEGTP